MRFTRAQYSNQNRERLIVYGELPPAGVLKAFFEKDECLPV